MELSRVRVALLLGAAFQLAACSAAQPSSDGPVREVLPNGAERVYHSVLDTASAVRPQVDLRIGALDGDSPDVFGDVRSIEADGDANIYVMDVQAFEVRVFSPEGNHLRTIGGEGAGPGEFMGPNGMIIAGDSLLWVQDPRQWKFLKLTLDGHELERVPMHELSYGYVSNTLMDDAGRLWKPVSKSDRKPGERPEPGLLESRTEMGWSSFDPPTGVVDTVWVGEATARTWVQVFGNGMRYSGVPFDARTSTVIDPAGGFWLTDASTYRVVHLDAAGDTTLVLEAEVEPLPVTGEDREWLRDAAEEEGADALENAVRLEEYMRQEKPVISRILTDDEGRLWVERTVERGATPLFDVFTRTGDYVSSVRLAFQPRPFLLPRIRGGYYYAVEAHELDVPIVVRAKVDLER